VADRFGTREFFGPRAATWDAKFPDDGPAFTRAVAELDVPADGVLLDVGCGTGRALPVLRTAAGPGSRVLGVDLTPEMLAVAATRGAVVGGDALHLPVASGAVDAVLAAGLISHLPDPVAGLAELARVCRPGGRLALFHPVGRVALAARHGREPDPDDVRGPDRIRAALAAAGWRCDSVDDAEDRYLTLATR
jgi:SAM-dependent methyltransferase